jgi:hypothetical protein
MGMRGFERRLEQMVEGGFARVFRSGLRPVELGRRLVRAMDDHRSVGVSGEPVAPNHFVVELSADDHADFAEVLSSLQRELAEAAREHARDEGYAFLGPVEVEIGVHPKLRRGSFRVGASLREGAGGQPPGSLVLPDGQVIVLGEAIFSIGRLPDCTLVIEDPNVSRHHAEIRPHGAGFRLVDLASTNGTVVNGHRIGERQLVDGDRIEIGSAALRFQAS